MKKWKVFALIMISLLIIATGIRFARVEPHILWQQHVLQHHVLQLNMEPTAFAISTTSHEVKNENEIREDASIAVRFLLGFTLMILSLRAFLKTKATAMFYLSMGFAFIAVGNLISAIYYINDLHMDRFFANIFDIIGLIALIIAVKKS